MNVKACYDMGLKDSEIVTESSQKKLTNTKIALQIYTSEILNKVKLSPSAKLMLFAMAYHYPNIHPSQKYIAQHTGMSQKSIERATLELKEVGLIDYETRKVNKYSFTLLFWSYIKGKEIPVQNLDKMTVHKDKTDKMSNTNGQNDRSDTDKMTDKHDKGTCISKNNHSSYSEPVKNDDDLKNKLIKWNVFDVGSVFKNNKEDEIAKIIDIVESKKPTNKGAYFNVLLKNKAQTLANYVEQPKKEKRTLEERINDKTYFLSDKDRSKIVFSNAPKSENISDEQLKEIIEIKEFWNFPLYESPGFETLETKRKINFVLDNRMKRIEEEVKHEFQPYRSRIAAYTGN